jgi:flagellar protein FliS
MPQEASGEYLRNAVLTASGEQLVLMLYDGAIRFARQAKEALARKDFEGSCDRLLRAQRIVQELQAGLRGEANPELARQMNSLYTFIYERLVQANMTQQPGPIDEALKILEHQRETWRMLLDKVRSNPAVAAPPSKALAQPVAGAVLSVEG